MPKANLQTIENKRGEVTFRKKLVNQHIGNTIVSPGEPNFFENIRELQNRLTNTQTTFEKFLKRKLKLSPFLEIAAGEGFRSDLLVSRFRAQGFATDISQQTLAADKIITQELKLNKYSIKICCDAYNLPFLSNSFPFVFVALSLHHFPDPAPIIKEAARVLIPDGVFYFDEEPIKQGLNLNLWRRGYHLRWFEKILKYTLVLIWLSRIGKAEVEHGILEETFPLSTWEKALAPFYKAEVEETVFPFKRKVKRVKSSSPHWIYPNWLTRLGLYLFGGGIEGLGQIKKSGKPKSFTNILEYLGCPNCREKTTLQPLKLVNSQKLICRKCHVSYIKRAGVWIILEKRLEQKLYGTN